MQSISMTRAVSALWLLIATAPTWAQTSAPKPTAETSFVLASTKIHVPVRVGDVETWFILDSGANVSILDRSLAEEFGLELRGHSKQAGGAGAGGFTVAFTRLPHLAWAGLESRDVPMAVIDRLLVFAARARWLTAEAMLNSLKLLSGCRNSLS